MNKVITQSIVFVMLELLLGISISIKLAKDTIRIFIFSEV